MKLLVTTPPLTFGDLLSSTPHLPQLSVLTVFLDSDLTVTYDTYGIVVQRPLSRGWLKRGFARAQTHMNLT